MAIVYMKIIAPDEWGAKHCTELTSLQSSLVAEDSREHCHGSLSGKGKTNPDVKQRKKTVNSIQALHCTLNGLSFRACWSHECLFSVVPFRCLIRSWMPWRLRLSRRRPSIPGSPTRWTRPAPTFCSSPPTSGTFPDPLCWQTQSRSSQCETETS